MTTAKVIETVTQAEGLNKKPPCAGTIPHCDPCSGKPGGDNKCGSVGKDIKPPDVNDIAKHMIERFDADKDGKLNAEELAKALAAKCHAHHPPPPDGPKNCNPPHHPPHVDPKVVPCPKH